MSDFIVYTYDNLEAVAAVLNGVASIMGSTASGYRDMIKTVGILGFLVAIASFLVNPTRLAGLSWFGGFMLVYMLLFLPVTSVNIIDKGRPGNPFQRVGNVPAALALTASVSSTVGYRLTLAFETAMQALPMSLGNGSSTLPVCASAPGPEGDCMFRFSKGGMMFGNKLLGRVQQVAKEGFAAVDPDLEKDMHEFLSQCTAFDLSEGRLLYKDISKATDLWSAISNTSPARWVTEAGVFKECPDAYEKLSGRVAVTSEKLETRLARTLFPNLADSKAKELLNSSYQDVAAATGVGDASSQVKKFILQNTMVNQAKQGFGRMGLEAGSASAVMLGTAEATAFSGTNASYIIQSRLAEEALPLIRNGIEAILYGIFPIVVLVMMVQTGTALVTAIKGFAFAFIWIQLWPPLYAVVNYIAQVRSMQSLRIITESMRGAPTDAIGVAFSNYNNIYNGQLSDQAVMGYLIIAVPAIASAIIYGMNSAMGAIGGTSFIGGSGRSAEAVGSGNVNMGNVSMGQQTLGPSRVDADVFSHTTKGGTFKYGLGEDGSSSYLGGQFNSTSGPFSIKLTNQNVDQLKESYAEELSTARTEQTQLSNAVSAAFQKALSQDEGFNRFVQASEASKHATTGSETSSTAAGDSTSDSAVNSKSGSHSRTDSSGVSHNSSTGAKLAGMGSSKERTQSGDSTHASQTGDTTSHTGQSARTSSEQLALMEAYGKEKGYATGDQKTISVSENQQLTLGEASQKMHSLSEQISHAEKVSKSLDSMQTQKATVEQDLLHRATAGLNAAMGDASYVQNLTDDEKREQLTAYAGQLLVAEHGLSKEEASRLLDTSGAHFNRGNAQVANTVPDLKDAKDQPENLYAAHAGGIYTHGITPDSAVRNREVVGQVASATQGMGQQIASQAATIQADAAARIAGSEKSIADETQGIISQQDAMYQKNAGAVIATGTWQSMKELGQGAVEAGTALQKATGVDKVMDDVAAKLKAEGGVVAEAARILDIGGDPVGPMDNDKASARPER